MKLCTLSSLVRVVREKLVVIQLATALGPVLLAASAHENHSHLVFRWLGVVDSFVMVTPRALYIFAARQCRILDTLRVNLEVLCAHREVSAVDTVVRFTGLVGILLSVAEPALEDKVRALIVAHLLRVKHVVALRAEAHPLELIFLALARCLGHVLLRHHSCLL